MFVIRYYLALCFIHLASCTPLHVMYTTSPRGPYATVGVPLSTSTARRHASCPLIIHHLTTATSGHPLCTDRYIYPYNVHDSAGHLRDAACSAWLRVFVAPDIPSDGWALYLDADTIVTGDLCAVRDGLPETGYLAAVQMDHYALRDKDFFNATQLLRLGVTRLHRKGLNNGVFAFHPARWRAANATMRMWQWQITAHYAPTPLFHYNDMAAMSLVALEDGYTQLDARLNCMRDGLDGCVVRHFAGKRKPWDMAASELGAYNVVPHIG